MYTLATFLKYILRIVAQTTQLRLELKLRKLLITAIDISYTKLPHLTSTPIL
jgi:hypothetical protein